MAAILSLREKIGQMLMTGFPGTSLNPEYQRLVEVYKVGNVILFSHNIENCTQIQNLNLELQSLILKNTGIPAYIAVDQEGGMVSRLSSDCTGVPGAMAVSATGDSKNARLAGEITARELSTLGINCNLAPVLDINCNPKNPVIGVRSYGDQKEPVSDFGLQMMQGLHDGGVIPVVKHFPGHGDTSVDSHLSLPAIHKTIDELEDNELVPFRKAITSGAPCVMTSHILFPAIEKEEVPATMSHTIITGLLKNKLGFNGLVMTDCMEMNAIREYFGTAQGAVAAVKAGVHIITISHTPELVEASAMAIETAVLSGEIPMRTIDEAVEKILEYKRNIIPIGNPVPDINLVGCEAHRKAMRRLSQNSITLVSGNIHKQTPLKGKFLFLGSYAYRSTLASSAFDKSFNFPEYMSGKLGGVGITTSLNPTEAEISGILEIAKGYDCIVMGTYNGHLNTGQITLGNKLCTVNQRVIVIALRNPYDAGLIKGCALALATYEYTKSAFDALAEVLRGEIPPRGTLPVKL